MATEEHRQKILVKDLPTKSVTLYPSRAHVTRVVNDVSLKPGINEVEIYGLTPTADENSIQIEGHGATTVTDTTVELVTNKEIFEEVYPEESDDEESESEEEYQDSDDEPEEMKSVAAQLKKLSAEKERLTELQNTVNSSVQILDSFTELQGKFRREGVPRPRRDEEKDTRDVNTVSAELKDYISQRMEMRATFNEASEELNQVKKQISRLKDEQRRLGKEKHREAERLQKAKEKAKVAKNRQKAELKREKRRTKTEREKFWPKKVYRIFVHLEANIDTPMSSRRTSMDSVTLAQNPETSSTTSLEKTVTLSLSYVVHEAFWSPRYDIAISSVKKTATISYRAEFTNHTSETWKDSTVTLSTSQTSFSGLEDTPPQLQPWNVKLVRGFNGFNRDSEDLLLSREEMLKAVPRSAVQMIDRKQLFATASTPHPFSHLFPGNAPKPAPASDPEPEFVSSGGARTLPAGTTVSHRMGAPVPQQALFGVPDPPMAMARAIPPPPPPQAASSLFGSSANSTTPSAVSAPMARYAARNRNSGFGSSTNNVVGSAGSGLFGGTAPQSSAFGQANMAASAPDSNNNSGGNYASTPAAENVQALEAFGRMAQAPTNDHPSNQTESPSSPSYPDGHDPFNDPAWTDAGLTTTHALPGTHTLAPSTLTRRHKIATLHIPSLTFSHTSTPKLRAAAFLRAHLTNPSSTITLLSGPAGLTLDNAFLGTHALPYVAAGSAFEVPLGVDAGLRVSYARPRVWRGGDASGSGGFGFGGGGTGAVSQRREVVVTNDKAGPVEICVREQVPMSQDEKVRVRVVQPKGLGRDGDVVGGVGRAGEGEKMVVGEGKRGEGEWGSATAELRKDGEVVWTVKLEKGRACLLELEFEIQMPASDRIAVA